MNAQAQAMRCACPCHTQCIEHRGYVLMTERERPLLADTVGAMLACARCRDDHDGVRLALALYVGPEPSPKLRKHP